MVKKLQKKPQLSFWTIWNMSFGFLGIQFGFALQNANVSRIFQTLGAEMGDISILWLAAPVTGLLLQPLIGYYSDRTWTRLGRRRPFFLVGAIIASIGLCFMPNSITLWMAAAMLWIMDTSFNLSMEPFRAFVGDNLADEQRTKGFAMQSFFIGVGAVVASSLPYIFSQYLGISNEAAEGVIPDSVKWSFYTGAFVFMSSILWTVFKSTEYSPEELAAFQKQEENTEAFTALTSKEDYIGHAKKQAKIGGFLFVIGASLSLYFFSIGIVKDLYVVSGGILAAGLIYLIAAWYQRNGQTDSTFVNMTNDIAFMPKTMKQLAAVQFFSWFALFAMWIYTTGAVTEHIYGTTDPTSARYNEGADWVGICFAVYNAVTAVVAFLLPVMAKYMSRKVVHSICLFMGAIGLGSIFFISNPNLLLVSMIGIGIAWASILTMPYAILTGVLPASKMGYYMGVFNFFIVIPQILAAAILGFVLNNFFKGGAIYVMLIGAIAYVIAALLSLMVEDN